MTPYHETELGKLYCGDCLTVMREIKENSIDLILTDPPYGINYLSGWTNNHKIIKNDDNENYKTNTALWLQFFRKLLTETACCCCCCGGGKIASSAILTLEAIKYLHLIQTIIWDKKTIGLGWKYRPSYETILVLSKSKDKYNWYTNRKDVSNIIKINNIIPQKGDHPTPKPIKLMETFILLHSKEKDLVLDPFIGSGTTAIACEKLGRKWIGIEISEEYCEIAKQRIEQEARQLKMF